MNKDAIYKIMKGAYPNLDNKIAFFMADCIWTDVKKWHKSEMKAVEDKSKALKSVEIDPLIQQFLDNPMEAEDESKLLRAMLHAGLSTGTLSPQLLQSLDKIIGVNSGDDTAIEVVDFGTAFPTLADAIEVCSKEQPTV